MMSVKSAMHILLVGALAWLGSVGSVAWGEPGTVVLDGNSPWRWCRAFKHPYVRMVDGRLLQLELYEPRNRHMSPPKTTGAFGMPPADWAGPEFDDSLWVHTRVPIYREGAWGRTPMTYATALIALRGKFEVKDPAQVKELVLSLSYYGGAVVYLNGKEVARGHLPGNKCDPEALAEEYPKEAYLTPDDKVLVLGDKKNADRLVLRERRISDVRIPPTALRKGVNVLAIENHRAPTSEAYLKAIRSPAIKWPPIEPLSVSLSVSPPGAATPNRVRPEGIQVWTCLPAETVTVFDFGDPCETAPSISIPAARNGVFSGRLLVSSGQPIKGLKVTVSDMAGAEGGAKIPTAAFKVRYAEPVDRAKVFRMPGYRFNGLLEAIPAEVPVSKVTFPAYNGGTYWPSAPDRTSVTAGAVASLWLTVRVPKDANPGRYEGTVTVSAEGLKSTFVPVKLQVSAWTVPDPKDFRVMNFGQSSPESLAKYYEVPMWSEKHLELLGKSMARMAEINSRRVDATLAVDFFGSGGNAEGMVRWIKQPDGSYKHDFSAFDKCLDTAAKAIGKPSLLRLNCWAEWQRHKDAKLDKWTWNGAYRSEGSRVTVLDPATGKTEAMEQPGLDKPEQFMAFWKPVIDEALKKIKAREWLDVTALGQNSYCVPAAPQMVSAARKLWPEGVWAYTAHNGTLGAKWKGVEPGVEMLARYADGVWTHSAPKPRGCQEILAPRPGFWCFTFRGHRDLEELHICREIPEWEIAGGQDGYSDFGVDFFPIKKDNTDIYYIVGCGRGTGGPNDGTLAWLAPGPDGPIVTERFEALREGVEIAEAIVFLERALLEKKIGGDLAQRVNRCLDERGAAFSKREDLHWGWCNSRFDEDEQLLAIAGEVAAAIGGGK